MRFLLVTTLWFCISCTDNSAVSKKLSGSDSLVIRFYAPQTDSVIKLVSTTERKAINRVSEFVSAKETEPFKCGYDGDLLFYEKGKQVSDVSFKYSEQGCRHFLLDAEGKLTSTKMSNEAADFLESLAKGKEIYW